MWGILIWQLLLIWASGSRSFSLRRWTQRRRRRLRFPSPPSLRFTPAERDRHFLPKTPLRFFRLTSPLHLLTLVAASLQEADFQYPDLLENSLLSVFCPRWTSPLLRLRLCSVGGGWEETGVPGRAFVSNWSAGGASVAGTSITTGALHLPYVDHVPLCGWMWCGGGQSVARKTLSQLTWDTFTKTCGGSDSERGE